MRSRKKRKIITVSLNINPLKKKKNILSFILPIPEHLINNNELVEFHFNKKFRTRKFVKRLSAILNDKLPKSMVACNHATTNHQCFMVTLTRHQFNQWLGEHAYERIHQINQYHKNKNTGEKLGIQLNQVNASLANFVALLRTDDIVNFSQMAMHVKPEVFHKFILLLDTKILDIALAQEDNSTGYSSLMWVAKYQSSEVLISLLDKMDKESCDRIAQIVGKDKLTILDLLADCDNPEIFLTFINKLSDETCNKLALVANKQASTFDEIISNEVVSQVKDKAFRAFVAKLSDTTCNQLALDQNANGDSTFQFIALTQAPTDLMMFINRLTTDTCKKAAFLVKGNNFIFNTIMATLAPKSAELFLEKLGLTGLALEGNLNCANFLIDLATHKQKFMSFLQNLSQKTCDHIASKDQALNKMAMYISPELFQAFFMKLSPEAYIHLGINTSLLQSLDQESGFQKIISEILLHPKEVKEFSKFNVALKSISFHDGGESRDNWSQITESIVAKAPKIKKKKNYNLFSKLSSSDYPEESSTTINKIVKKEWELLRLQGRTIILHNKEGDLLALKVKKNMELVSDLVTEYKTTNYLKEHAHKLNLKSSFPSPLKISKITGIFDWLAPKISTTAFTQFKKMVENSDLHSVYLYQVNPKQCDYFTYLHDLRVSDEMFKKSNRDAIHDLFTLLKFGITFPQLADIFHNSEEPDERSDKGRYLILVNLLRVQISSGSGRLTAWKQAVEYPNVRPSGLVDLGDCASLNEFIGKTQRVTTYYREAWNTYGEKTGNFLIANLMAEYQYVLFLIAGRRGADLAEQAKKMGKSADEIQLIWLLIAHQIVDNCAYAISILTHESQEEIKEFLVAITDVSRLGRQMGYWMTPDYIFDVMHGVIRNGIYEKDTQIKVKFYDFRSGTFNSKLGCSIDGIHPDLGPVNGQEPIKEANKLIYWTVSYIFSSYNTLRLTLEDMHKITKENDPDKSEAIRLKSFTHLSKESYHAIQGALCLERLKQKVPIATTMKKSLHNEQEEHARQYAACKIGNWWRKHKGETLVKHEAKIIETTRHNLKG